MSTDKYQLLDRIAKGGMAELFRARVVGAEGFSKILAIKRILPNLADEKSFVDMLIDEARLVALLSHPNIVQVFELNKDETGYFIAMEFVNGPNLAAILKRLSEQQRRIPEACALDIAIQLLQALDYAHRMTDAQGQELHLIHRDVSPENVLISATGAVKLSDFGVAKAKNRLHLTQAGNIKGKVPYMSPEQLQGLEIDGRTDIFAAGLILWECLAGERHYIVDKLDLSHMRNVAEGRIRDLGELGVSVPREVDIALKKALSPKKEDRYATAWEFANDLMLYHRRAYPAHSPVVLGKLVTELFKSQLDALAERLRQFEQGTQEPSGVLRAAAHEPSASTAGASQRGAATKPAQPVAPSALVETRPSLEPAAEAAISGVDLEFSDTTIPARPAKKEPKRTRSPAKKGPPDISGANTEKRSPGPKPEDGEAAAIDAALKVAKDEETREKKAKRGDRSSLLVVGGGFGIAMLAVMGLVAIAEDEPPPPPPPVDSPLPRVVGEAEDEPMRRPAPSPSPQRPAAPPVAVKPDPSKGAGFLSLTCEPECEIEIDGARTGLSSPQTAISLAAGVHKVRAVNRQLNLSRTIPVEIEKDRTTTRAINLVMP